MTKEDYNKIKPEPDIYLQALELSAYGAANILVVEDTPGGIQAAKAAGLTAIAIPHDLTVGLDFSKADYSLDSIFGLPELIQEIDRPSN